MPSSLFSKLSLDFLPPSGLSPTRLPIDRISQERILEWVAISFSIYAEYIVWYARMGKAQTGIKITGRNINNLRYADDTTLMAESKEELKSPLMKVKKESEKLVPSFHGK